MSNTRVASRFAAGLWEYALSVNEEETIVNEMLSLIEIIKETKEFRFFLNSPIIETEKKIKIGKEILKSYSNTTQNFFVLLARRKREKYLLDIAQQVLALNDEHKGIQRVTITSAIPLDKEITSEILKTVPLINLSKAQVENKIDEGIIGGYILRLKDQELDASVKTELENIKKKFKEKVY